MDGFQGRRDETQGRKFGYRGSLIAIRPSADRGDTTTSLQESGSAASPAAWSSALNAVVDAGVPSRPTNLLRVSSAEAALGPGGLGKMRLDDLADQRENLPRISKPIKRVPFIGIDQAQIKSLPLREQSLLAFMLAQDALRFALTQGPVVELRAKDDELRASPMAASASLKIGTRDAAEAQAAVGGLNDELGLILLHNALQFLPETRQFLALCFSKLRIGGTLVITVPHQFLYERKLRLPSRRNRLHRRFYTANTLLADIEEALDPCQYRIRFLGENDAGYDFGAELNSDAEGGQDIVVALEKLAPPAWRPELAKDDIWIEPDARAHDHVELKSREPGPILTVGPDRQGVGRIILLKLDHRGDLLLATEAFRTFRNTFAAAHITLVCGSWNVAEAKKADYFDEVLAFDFFSEDELAGSARAFPEFLIDNFAGIVGREQYDLAVDLRLYDDTRELLQVINAHNRAGFDRYDSFPWLSIRLNTPSGSADDRAEAGLFKAEQFSTSICKRRIYGLEADASFHPHDNNAIIWGPYQELKPGRYQFECLIEPLAEDFEVQFDITRDAGSRTIVAGLLPVRRAQHPCVHFQLDERIDSFELRLVGSPAFEVKPFRFLGVRFVRPGVIRAVHQREAMALLAHLVRLRLHDAYRAELA